MTEQALAGGFGFAFGPTAVGGNERFGRGLASISDLTGDGQPERLIGAPKAWVGDGQRGKTCLYLSGNGIVIGTPPKVIDAGSNWLCFGLAAVLASTGGVAWRFRTGGA